MKLRVEFRGELPENWTPIDSVAMVKCLDIDGEPALCIRTSDGVTPWEALGMMEAGALMARDVLRNMFKEEGA